MVFLKKAMSALLVSAVLLSLAVGLVSCSALGKYDYENGDTYTMGHVNTTQHVRAIEIFWEAGKVSIEISQGSAITAIEDRAEADELSMHHKIENGTLRIYPVASGADATGFLKNLTVKIPLSLYKDVEVLSVETVSADVSVGGLTLEGLSLKSKSGDLAFQRGSAKAISIETDSGESWLSVAQAPKSLDFNSDSGNLLLEMVETVGFTALMESDSGTFTSDLNVYKNGNVYSFGDTAYAEYRFETDSGNVTVNKWAAK